MLPENEGLSELELRQVFHKYDENGNMELGRKELLRFHHDHTNKQGTAATENRPRSPVNGQRAREAPLLSSGRMLVSPVEVSMSHPIMSLPTDRPSLVTRQQFQRDDDPSPQARPGMPEQAPPNNVFISSLLTFGGIFPQSVVDETHAAPAHPMMGHAHLEAENQDDLDLPVPVESPRSLDAGKMTRDRARQES
jgi:hypothetical protein